MVSTAALRRQSRFAKAQPLAVIEFIGRCVVLTLTFLGVGSAFAKRNLQSNALIEAWSAGPDSQPAPDETLLIDCGTTGPMALHQLKDRPEFAYLAFQGRVRYPAIHRIFVTHQHSDHIGGLEELAGTNIHLFRDPDHGRSFKPQLIAPTEILAGLWEHSLRGGLGALGGRCAALEDYFEVLELRTRADAGRDSFTMLDRYEFTVFPTDHVRVQRKYDWPSFGLYITDRQSNRTCLYSGDTRFDPDGMGEMIGAAGIIFHEVQLEDQPDSVHATLSQLRSLPEPVRRRMILYHYSDTWDDSSYDFVAKEFRGFARPQQRYPLFE